MCVCVCVCVCVEGDGCMCEDVDVWMLKRKVNDVCTHKKGKGAEEVNGDVKRFRRNN